MGMGMRYRECIIFKEVTLKRTAKFCWTPEKRRRISLMTGKK